MANISETEVQSVIFTTLNGHGVTASSLAVDFVLFCVGFLITFLNAIVLDTLLRRTVEATDFLMCQLAITDMITGLFVIYNVVYHVVYFLDETDCLLRIGGSLLFTCNSVFHLALLTFDRFVQIVFPYRYQDIITKKSVSIMSSAVWIFSINIGLLPLYGWNKTPLPGDPPCSLLTVLATNYTTLVLVTFFIPVCVIGMMYCRIYLVARRHARAIASTDVKMVNDSRKQLKFAKTVILLIGTYLVTMLPLGTFTSIFISGGVPNMKIVTAHSLTIYASIFSYCNSLVNPIIYAFKLPPVRRRFLTMLRRKDRSRDLRTTTEETVTESRVQ